MIDVEQTLDKVVRTSHGRLVAFLGAECRDLGLAEDALSDAYERAVVTWPDRGIPTSPEAWLLTTARRRIIDRSRHVGVATKALPDLALKDDERASRGHSLIPDKRLELLFVCAHPAIDASIRPALMLQTVLGLDAVAIASAFLTKPATMGQRLVRAKRKIRDAGISFRVPEADELEPRLDSVLDAIYACFGTGWDREVSDETPGLADEAIALARLVTDLLPEQVEPYGLLALMLYSHARRGARRTPTGDFVPLAEQNTAQWDNDMIDEAHRALGRIAGHLQPIGAYSIEALIQGVHAWRAVSGETDWARIVSYYELLEPMVPTVGVKVAHAAGLLEARGPKAALAKLEELAGAAVESYQPFWAVKGHSLARLGDIAAPEALERAAGLASDPAVRRYLLAQAQLATPPEPSDR